MENRFCAHPGKATMIGVGSVGASLVYPLMIHGVVSEISLIDANAEKAMGEAMGLEYDLPFSQPARMKVGDYGECADVDIVDIAACAAQQPGESRFDLVERNVAVFKQVIPKIKEHNEKCILLVATNPVDIMPYVSLKLSGFPLNRVTGSGTILDTSRLRSLIGAQFKIGPRNFHAYIIEHDDSEAPVWSLTSIAGVNLDI
jgi:L-lactate dehydrogenase